MGLQAALSLGNVLNCTSASTPNIAAITNAAPGNCTGASLPVKYAIADRLAQAEGEWKLFDCRGLKALLYPASGHVH